jgi:hypothetical protein
MLLAPLTPVVALALTLAAKPGVSFVEPRPRRTGDAGGYVTSDACRPCHERNYTSWRASYHRRMTQLAGPEALEGVAPRWRGAGITLRAGERSYHLHERAGALWVTIQATQTRARTARLALTTGSHHMQLYWLPSERGVGRELALLPFAYLREERRFIPRSAAFLQPPAEPAGARAEEAGHWNTNCIHCHATAGRISTTGVLDDMQSRVAELGVGCEACHGPGAAHVAAHRAAKERRDRAAGPAREPGAVSAASALVNPADLPGRRAAEVCGQCHGVTAERVDARFTSRELLATGHRYRPGDDLGASRIVIQQSEPGARALLAQLSGSDAFWEGTFWPDGMVRVAGRELGGFLASPCAKSQAFSCLSCHRMHPGADDPRPLDAWAADQLAPGMDGDRACLGCHERLAPLAALTTHTRHAPDSPGSRCMNCHMPYTTYGLLKAVRSHQISSPTVTESLASGRPNACNQCHLDRALSWTAALLASRYRTTPPTPPADASGTAAALTWLHAGEAGQRALMAWSFGWEAAWRASGKDWLAPHLAELLDDPYEAIRFIAARSLRRLEGFGALRYDFLAPAPERRRAAEEVRARGAGERGRQRGEALLFAPHGSLRSDLVAKLKARRDDRPIRLQE